MFSVSRRLAAVTFALAVAVVPVAPLHARPAEVEGAASSWTAIVLDYLSKPLDALGWGDDPPRRPPATSSRDRVEVEDGGGNELRPWWDPNGGTVDAVVEPAGELRPWWDPNG